MVNQIAHVTPAEHLPPLPDHASALCPQPCSTETSALHGQHFLQLLQLLPPLTQSVLHGVRIVWQLHACELPPDLLPQLTCGAGRGLCTLSKVWCVLGGTTAFTASKSNRGEVCVHVTGWNNKGVLQACTQTWGWDCCQQSYRGILWEPP